MSGIMLGSEDTEISETLLLRAQRGEADRCQGDCIASTKVKSMGSGASCLASDLVFLFFCFVCLN